MDADLADHHQAGVDLLQIIADRLEGFTVQQHAGEVDAFLLGDAFRNIKVGLVDLGDAVVDQFLMQLFLLLEAEHLAGFVAQHIGDLVERHVMVIGIVGRDGMDIDAQLAAYLEGRHQGAVGFFRTVQTDHDGAVADGAVGVADDQRVDRAAADDPFADRTDDAARHGAETDGAERQNLKIAVLDGVDQAGVVLTLGAEAAVFQLGLVTDDLRHVVVAVADDVEALGDQRIVHVALILHLLLDLVAFRQTALHLAEAAVVELSGVGVNTRDDAVAGPGQPQRFGQGPVGMARGIERHEDSLERRDRLGLRVALVLGRHFLNCHLSSPISIFRFDRREWRPPPTKLRPQPRAMR